MKRGIKIIFWIVGLIAALPAGLFIIGFIGGLTGSPPPTTPEPLQEITSEKLEASRRPVTATPPQENQTPAAPPRSITILHLPDNYDAKSALSWMSENKLIGVKNGSVNVRFEYFRGLSVDDALTLHTLFEDARHTADIKFSTPETESEKRRYYMARLLVFAGASAFPQDRRRKFANRSGAVFPDSFFNNGRHRGDYVNLFEWHKSDTTGSAETAIRAYTEILSDKDIIQTLKILGVIKVYGSGTSANKNSRWTIEMGDTLSQFEPSTLQAIHDAIKKTIAGDRPKLRKKIRKLIESRHTADVPPTNESETQ